MLARALFLRPIVRRPLRFLVTVAGVAAGVAALVATLASSRAALASLREGVGELAGATRLEISAPGGLAEDYASRLREIASDAWILPVVEKTAVLPALDDVVRLLGVDPLLERGVRTIELGEGSPEDGSRESASSAALLATLRGEGAWISTELARELGLARGDALELELGSTRRALPLLGTFSAPGPASAWRRVVLVDVALAQEIAGTQGELDRLELVPRPGVDVEELRARVAALLPPGVSVSAPSRRASETAGMVRAFEFNLTALSGISLFVAAVLVATTLATAVVQRRPTIALLRSLGAGDGDLVRTLLVEALGIGLFGSALGVAGGFFGARMLLASMRSSVATLVAGAPATPIRFEGSDAAVGLAVGVGVALVAAFLPITEALRTPPIQALSGESPRTLERRELEIGLALMLVFLGAAWELASAPAWNGLPVAALGSALCLLGALFAACAPAVDLCGRIGARFRVLRRHAITLRLSTAALAAGRRRAAWAAGAVGVAVALSVSIAALVHSFRTTVIDWTEVGLRADLSVRPQASVRGLSVGRLAPDLPARLEAEFGAGVVDPFHTAPGYVDGQRVTFAGAALDVARLHSGIPFRDGRDAREVFDQALRGGRAVVNEAFARRFGLAEGDTLRLSSGLASIERGIEGVFYDYGDSQGLVVVAREDYLAVHPGDGPREIALFLPPGTDLARARTRVSSAVRAEERITVLDRAEVEGNVLAVFDRTFAITRALQAVAALVAVIAVLSVLFALVAERRADLGLLAALGASRAQIAAQVCLQAGLLGMIGALGGTLCGLGIGLVLVEVVNLQSFGWTLAFHPPWPALAATLAGVVGACLAAGLLPAVSAARASLRSVIRDE